ncbi:MAG TPA: glycosyltransferase [Opitutaceae bacterium]|nr:glycosyltransferase [Opitutaceae bacterium]
MSAPLIAFVNDINGSKRSGCQLLWARAAQHLHRTGRARIALAFRRSDLIDLPEVTALLAAGCAWRIEEPATPSFPQRLARRLWHTPAADPQRETIAWLRALRPDFVVINQSGCIGVESWGPLLAAHGWPYATISQCVDVHMWPADERNRLLRAGYLAAKKNFFVSSGNQRVLETIVGVALPNAAVVSNPFRADFDAPFSWPARETPTRFACVARLFPAAKGQDLLLQALARPAWAGRDWQLTFAGEGPAADGLRQLAATLGLAHRVTFAGQVENIADLWRDHHALVLPSRYEGMALAVLEALVIGRPCITTDVADNRAHIRDGETGFIAAAPTVEHLAEALERAWATRARWREMGALAWQRARESLPRDPGAALAEQFLSLLG